VFALRLTDNRLRTVVVLHDDVDLAALPEIRAAFAGAFARTPSAIDVDLLEVRFFGSERVR